MTELIDVLDENGIKTGRVATRDEVHREGLWHRIILVAILDDQNHILLQQRSDNKPTNPGMWDIATAGHVDAGEDSLTAAVREVVEEIGIKIRPSDLRWLMGCSYSGVRDIHGEQWIIKHIHDGYLLRIPKIDVAELKLQDEEVQAVKLCGLAEFKQMIVDGTMVNRQPFYEELIKIMEAK